MRKSKAIIPLFLLFSYLIGVAHDLIPHIHTKNGVESAPHLHEHVSTPTKVLDSNKSSYYKHTHHFDVSFIDYLSCLLSGMQDEEDSFCDQNTRYINNIFENRSEASLLVLILLISSSFLLSFFRSNNVGIDWVFNPHYSLQPYLNSQQKRGPPSER